MANPHNFAEYVRSATSLDALEKLADSMDQDIEESQKIMDKIKTMFNTIPQQNGESVGKELPHKELSDFLEAGAPTLLMPDMAEIFDIDLDGVITSIKGYAEDLKRNYTIVEQKAPAPSNDMSSLDLDQYATSLDILGKRLANIKLSKPEEVNNRSPELEDKLTQLCQDINNFNQMVHTNTRVAECNKNWSEARQGSAAALQYNDVISKLLSGINEVTYLLHNKN